MFNIREVLHQIKKDVESGNTDAIAELISGLLNDGEEAMVVLRRKGSMMFGKLTRDEMIAKDVSTQKSLPCI